ncbi:MAG: type I-B CRISPR-associated endonuclease Cas1b [Thermoplasmataceae archaeon]|jgi:CRISPR-associated protein Cas1
MRKPIYVFSGGELKRRENTLFIENENFKRFIPVETVSEIYLFGETSLNTALLNFLSQNEIIVHYFNYYGYYSGSIYPRDHIASGEMIIKQAKHYLDSQLRVALAIKFVTGAIDNIIRVLKYYSSRGKDLDASIDKINSLRQLAESAKDIEYLMAIEGNAREEYYSCFNKIINDRTFRYDKRTKRPPSNPINALLSFGNSIIYTSLLAEIYKTHLDPRIAFLHSSNFRRFSLNLDVAEIFKPIIVDRVIFTILDRRELTEKNFEIGTEGTMLNKTGREIFLRRYEEKLSSTISHKTLGRNISYRRLMRLELYKIEKHLIGDQSYMPYVAQW